MDKNSSFTDQGGESGLHSTVDSSNIGESLSTQQSAVELTASHADLSHWLKLGNLSFVRFQRTADLSDIAESISAYQKVVDLAPVGHPDLPSFLNNLGNSFLRRFERTKDPADVAESISAHQRAVELTQADHPSLFIRLNSLGNSFLRRFELTGDLSDISESISTNQRAVGLTPDGHQHLPGLLSNLGNSFTRRFEHTGNATDIAKSISVHQRAVDLTPAGHPDLPARLNNLGLSFGHRFKRTGDPTDIAESISAHQRAFELTPADHPSLPGYLNNLGNAFVSRFEHTGDLSDITKSISTYKGAVYLTPANHPDLPRRLHNLGDSFARHFERTGDPSDIAKSISAHQKAVNLTPITHPDLPGWLANLGKLCFSRFERTNDLSNITEAISAYQSAVEFAPASHPDLPRMFKSLGASFHSRFELTGDLSDIAESISAQQQAVKLTHASHPQLPSMLSGLGGSFFSRFEHTGDLSDIAESILVQQRAVELTAAGDPDLPSRLNGLGNSFARRFRRTGDPSDIAKSISAQQRAIEIIPAEDPNLPKLLNNLGTSFAYRFEYTGDLSDVAESISAYQRAVELTPAGDSALPGRLNNLGNSFSLRYEVTGDDSDIAQSISANQKAVDLTPAGHPELPGRLHNLGNSFFCRVRHTYDILNNAESISGTQGMVEFTPAPGQADLPQTADDLTGSSNDHPLLTAIHDGLKTSITHYMSAATCGYGPPSIRMGAAKLSAKLLYEHIPDSPQTLTAFDTAIRLVSQVASLDQTVQHRHTQLQDISGLPRQAAAAGCSLGRVDKALEWSEQSRCLVWSQLNNLRTQLADLRAHDPMLAERVLDVSRQLEYAGSNRGLLDITMPLSDKISAEDEARAHLELAKEWDKLIDTVRSTIPGFENFLQPSPCSTLLQHLPDSGPIVLINVHKVRCDAIALLAGRNEPLHIPLPDFSQQKASTYSNNLADHLRSKELRAVSADTDEEEDTETERAGRGIRPSVGKGKRSKLVSNTLGALWKEVVKPVLDALGFSRLQPSSETALPRIWWCPTGPVSFLPLHAAGIYGGKDADSILNYVVSSYTPSITLLAERVKNGRSIDQSASGLFLTSQPNVSGLASIPGTTKEVTSIHKQALEHGVRVVKLEGDAVTVDMALEHMEQFSCIHLACHASQDQKEPLQSRFRFHSGSLELSKIIQRNLKNADLAFLSACQTSTGEERLSEEVVHLAAGMLAAGYRRVVATMWAIEDKYAPEVATDFYHYLSDRQVEAGSSGLDGSHSAYALHHAAQQLRQRLDDSERSLLAWIPYVHFGF